MIKICGLSTPETLEAALAAGADMVGFVRVPRSPRYVELARGRDLSRQAQGRAARVLLLVDPSDAELDETLAAFDPDLVQLHGRETPERARAIRSRAGRPVMKAIGVAEAGDLADMARFRGAVDRLLLDAKPSLGAALPGGNGVAFDWRLLAGLDPPLPIMLSGGLTPSNVADAIAVTSLAAVDVSSGVERAPGRKEPSLIAAFVRAARAAWAGEHERTIA